MKTDLDYLPDRKRRDLDRIVEVLFAEFEDATRLATQQWKKQGRILKVILYGSYARAAGSPIRSVDTIPITISSSSSATIA